MKNIRLIVDCGTTNLRVMLLDGENNVVCTVRGEGGVKHTAIDGHNGKLRGMLRDCIQKALDQAGCRMEQIAECIAYGMITSNMGLLEIPHLAAPASKEDLRRGMREAVFEDIAPFPIRFIPGVRNFTGSVSLGNFSGMDMMRGEETEAIGLFELLKPKEDCVFVLPGSHNKFVMMDKNGSIQGCMTSISGELLDVITHGTILADSVGRSFVSAEAYDREMAAAGALECAKSGIGRAAFGGRILQTLGAMEKEKIQSYLLGAVIATDVQALRAFSGGQEKKRIFVAGKAPLQTAVCDVMEVMGEKDVVPVNPSVSAAMGVTGALVIGL
ncbi:MAG: 2-dehydro-3-deoxygalactonokinase [Clostridia bacterium]|nr:2-dehydro-3-deoxygalactonokinase [Clostridia bacterium]